ncbi:hypothetical protein [Cyanobium sp. NIES-981]|uniref:hypothetical protein n=1 Tax=Cyanobium sp. NIES-981 TaxID=1851505 RepID=UPI0007DCBA2F|nr:hypothetical protein [Cyanobium sp. NIES-981]SBO42355.1 conserved protein of unknown function [Cyanobium sp. NIES-981]
MTPDPNRRGRLVAIVTGAISILVGVLYLGLILVLDSRGPLQPPPPEAFGLAMPAGAAALLSPAGVGAAGGLSAAAVPPRA